MIARLIRFLNRPVLIVLAPPSRPVLVACWCLLAPLWPLVHIADFMTTVITVEGDVPRFHESDPIAAGALTLGDAAGLAVQKVLVVALGIAWVVWSFRLWPRFTIALLALLCALVVAAVLWDADCWCYAEGTGPGAICFGKIRWPAGSIRTALAADVKKQITEIVTAGLTPSRRSLFYLYGPPGGIAPGGIPLPGVPARDVPDGRPLLGGGPASVWTCGGTAFEVTPASKPTSCATAEGSGGLTGCVAPHRMHMMWSGFTFAPHCQHRPGGISEGGATKLLGIRGSAALRPRSDPEKRLVALSAMRTSPPTMRPMKTT